jgi:hypothetical protein
MRVFADDRGLDMNELIEASVREFLDPQDYKSVSLKYLQRIDRKYSATLKRLDLVLETLGLLARLWFRAHPPPEDPELREHLRTSGESRFVKFLELIRDNLEGQKMFRQQVEER